MHEVKIVHLVNPDYSHLADIHCKIVGTSLVVQGIECYVPNRYKISILQKFISYVTDCTLYRMLICPVFLLTESQARRLKFECMYNSYWLYIGKDSVDSATVQFSHCIKLTDMFNLKTIHGWLCLIAFKLLNDPSTVCSYLKTKYRYIDIIDITDYISGLFKPYVLISGTIVKET